MTLKTAATAEAGAEGGEQGDQGELEGAGADDGQQLAEAGAEGAAASGAEGEGEGGSADVDLAAVARELGPATLKALLAAAGEEERQEILKEHLDSAEERGRQRAQEAREAQETRVDAYKVLRDHGAAARNRILKTLNAEFGENGELTAEGKALFEDIERYRVGAAANVGFEQEAELTQVRTLTEPLLKELTPEQKKELDQAVYQQATRGGLQEVTTRLKLAIQTLQTPAKGKKDGGGLSPEAAEKVVGLIDKLSKVGPKSPKGTGASVASERDQIRKEIAALDPLDPKFNEKHADLLRRSNALPKE